MCSIEKATDSVHTPNEDQPPLPPIALGLSLLELYFTRIYNAPLLFHKSVLFQQYLEQKLHGALLRALLALATLWVLLWSMLPLLSAGEYPLLNNYFQISSTLRFRE